MIKKIKAWIDNTPEQKLYRIEFWIDAFFVAIQLACIVIMIVDYMHSH